MGQRKHCNIAFRVRVTQTVHPAQMQNFTSLNDYGYVFMVMIMIMVSMYNVVPTDYIASMLFHYIEMFYKI